MDLIQPRRIVSLVSAVNDLSFFLTPSVEEIVHPFDALHDAGKRFLVGGDALYKIRIEHRIAPLQSIDVLVHVLTLLVLRHPVEHAAIERALGFAVTQLIVVDPDTFVFGERVALFVQLERPSLFRHLSEREPAIVLISALHADHKESDVV